MLLTDNEQERVLNALKSIHTLNLKFEGVKRLTAMWISTTGVKRGVLRFMYRAQVAPSLPYWYLEIGEYAISLTEDGKWWDVVREELPLLEIDVKDAIRAEKDKSKSADDLRIANIEYLLEHGEPAAAIEGIQEEGVLKDLTLEDLVSSNSKFTTWSVLTLSALFVVYWIVRGIL